MSTERHLLPARYITGWGKQTMGRPKYSDQERDQILVTFIRAAREIIQDEGIEKLSIRKVANITGLNSATMYLYFPNADALTTMACMSYLEKYCRTLAADMPLMQSNRDAFVHSWEIFSQYAFVDPQVFRHLFYTEHSFSMEETIDTYYRLFPHQLDDISDMMVEMLHAGSIEERSMRVLTPLAEELGFSKERTEMINELVVCYFRQLLEERCLNTDSMVLSEQLTAKLMRVLRFLLDNPA